MFLSYCGIRVTDLERALKFYTELFGLKEVVRGDRTKIGAGAYVLLRDPKSH
jgi:catechol 2,3-dioxygenase-like lactoylglutathione lyase family enzyme